MKKFVVCLLLVVLLTFSLAGCGGNTYGLDPKTPVTLTMWHNWGGTMQKSMDSLLDEFNSTVGKELGIIINVTAVSSSKELQENLTMIASGDPGALPMPDIPPTFLKRER